MKRQHEAHARIGRRILILLGGALALLVWAGGITVAPQVAAAPVAHPAADGKITPTPTGTPIKASLGNAPLTPYPTATCPPAGWSTASNYPIPVANNVVAVLGNRLLSFGGDSTRNAYQFTPSSGWTALPLLPQERSYAAAVADAHQVYIEGGMSNYAYHNTLWAWNPNFGTYQWLASAPVVSVGHALVYLNGKLYRIGGVIANTTEPIYTTEVDVYDIATNTWGTVAPYPAAAAGIMAVAVGGYIYAGGGNNGIHIAKTYRYDPVANHWDDAAVHDLPVGRAYAATAVLNGAWLLAGGFPLTTSTIALDLSNPTGSWQTRSSLPVTAHDWSGGVLGRVFYGVGSYTTTVRRYSDGCP